MQIILEPAAIPSPSSKLAEIFKPNLNNNFYFKATIPKI